MIQARHTRMGKLIFDVMVPFLIKRHFRDFVVEQHVEPSRERPVLFLANHFSWWDGFTHYYLNQLYFGKRFHVMMLEEELEKRMLFRNAGAFSVKHGYRSVLETIAYTKELLKNPGNCVLMFPPGRIQSLYSNAFPFQKGVEKVLSASPEELQVVLSVILPEYGANAKPALHCYLRELPEPADLSLSRVEEAFQAHYKEAIEHQQQKFRV